MHFSRAFGRGDRLERTLTFRMSFRVSFFNKESGLARIMESYGKSVSPFRLASRMRWSSVFATSSGMARARKITSCAEGMRKAVRKLNPSTAGAWRPDWRNTAVPTRSRSLSDSVTQLTKSSHGRIPSPSRRLRSNHVPAWGERERWRSATEMVVLLPAFKPVGWCNQHTLG